MNIRTFGLVRLVCLLLLLISCKKDEKDKGSVSATIMKSETLPASLFAGKVGSLTDLTGSVEQSFTPKSLKIPVFTISLCRDNSSCVSVYRCSGSTVDECGVELSNIEAFVDAINSAPAQIEEGLTFDHIAVQFCADGDQSGIQNVTLNGTVTIQGTEYATDTISGLVPGAVATDIKTKVTGGCASYYPISPSVTVSKDTPIKVRLFFDATNYAFAGIEGETFSNSRYSSDCAGSLSAYVCAPVITVVATVESGNPTTEHYLLADTNTANGSSDTSAATASVVLYFSSSGTPIGGVQNLYRQSGPDVSWGLSMEGGLGLYPKVVDANTVSFGEPEGSISLANWFKNFPRESHTGTYSYARSGQVLESTYKATKL